MATFTFSLIFNDGDAVETIVCHADSEIDRDEILMASDECMKQMFREPNCPHDIAHSVCKAINEQCDCRAVVVESDMAVNISTCSRSETEK